VGDSHIVEAQDLVQRGRLRNRIRDQTQHAQLLLETLAYLEGHEETLAHSKTIKTRCETVAYSAPPVWSEYFRYVTEGGGPLVWSEHRMGDDCHDTAELHCRDS